MSFKIKNFSEKYFWENQIKRHRIGKIFRNIVRENPEKTYKEIADSLKISRKTLWALINGLAIPSETLLSKVREQANENQH